MPEGKSDDLMEAAIRAVDGAREDLLLAKASDNTHLLRKVAISVVHGALLAERQRHSSVSWGGHRIDIAAFRQLIEDGKAFADTDPEAQFIADADNSCPHCGGSGHKDDVRPPSSTDGELNHD